MLKLGEMSNDNSSDSPNSPMLKFALEASALHEKQIDQLISRLSEEKEDLCDCAEKLSVNMEEITGKLEALGREIEQLKNVFVDLNISAESGQVFTKRRA
jgi:hypothetical protein